MKTAVDIKNLQNSLIKENNIKHNIEEFANKIVQIVSEYAKNNLFEHSCSLEFCYDDVDYQKYYLDDFDLTILLLKKELSNRDFIKVSVVSNECGVRTLSLAWW